MKFKNIGKEFCVDTYIFDLKPEKQLFTVDRKESGKAEYSCVKKP